MINFFGAYEGSELLIVIIAYVLVLVLALSMHEFAHAYVAHKQGDQTPKALGRLTLNPLAHIDTIGFLLILFVGFGWAKPVEVNPLKFRNYKKGMFLVSIAGVIVNITFAFIAYPLLVLLVQYGINMPDKLFLFLYMFLSMMFTINIALFTFNLIPVYPLDGFRVVETFSKYNNKYVGFMHKYGSIVLLLVVITLSQFNILSKLVSVIGWPITALWNLILV